MKVNVKVFSTFRKWLSAAPAVLTREKDGDKLVMEVKDGMTVNDLFGMIGIPDDIDRSFFVNGRHAESDTVLREGDTLLVLPLFGGG